MKFALLLSRIEASATLNIRTRHVELAGPDTVHGSMPSLAVLAKSVVGNVTPPSVERSIFTFPDTLLDVHWMFWEDPISQLSPPFGTLTVMVGWRIAKFALLMSESVGIDRLVIRIRDDELAGPGTDHGSVPSLAVLAAITVGNVEPPLVDSSIFTFPVRFVDAHVIVCDEPMTQLSPPFGDVTVIVG